MASTKTKCEPDAKDGKRVKLGKFAFESRDALVVYFRTILRGNKNGYRLTGDEFDAAKALLARHPKAEQKIGAGVLYIIVGANPSFPDTPSFMVVQDDAQQTHVDFSYLKIADTLFPEEGKERQMRKKPLSGILCRVHPVPLGYEKKLREFLEGRVGVDQRHLGRDPIITADGTATVQFVDPDDLTALIAGPPPEFHGKTLTVKLIADEERYWEDRKFERQQKRDEKEMKAQKKAMRAAGRGGRGGFRGGRGGYGSRGSGGRFGGDRDGGDGSGDFGSSRYGGSSRGAKRYGDDSGHSDGPGAKRARTNYT